MNRLKERRMELRLTQPQVAKRLRKVEPRIDAGMVSRFEKGVCLPTPKVMDALEETLQAGRLDLWPWDEIDLLPKNALRPPCKVAGEAEEGGGISEYSRERERTEKYYRKCYRVPREFAETLPKDLLSCCGYASWNDWHAACLRRLLAEYAARKKAMARRLG